jgi:hypothetical protein
MLVQIAIEAQTKSFNQEMTPEIRSAYWEALALLRK